eukprot:CAMPEP_0170211728 /NCGR_PEP_ID=MMETSP0116_2-20130129/5480_1 /TAXON_ID=400756 /ORGANISM="Durinskia baltica, Strain CSIRO CS-38" /LENGTH=156 /DNA_ID=CAMNT_0010462263 /DNA_START=666 /DNA_END=1133 /DNA_ORIENTATION=-
MNWTDFLPAAVRDMHTHSSEWEEGSRWSDSSFEYADAEPDINVNASYEQDRYYARHRTPEDMSSVDISYYHYGEDYSSRDDVKPPLMKKGNGYSKDATQNNQPPAPTLFSCANLKRKKLQPSAIRIPFFSDLFDMALSKPTPKKKFTRLLVPMGLP